MTAKRESLPEFNPLYVEAQGTMARPDLFSTVSGDNDNC
jgi:hypothetical protein